MSDGLREYERKRDFGKTSEPGAEPIAKSRGKKAAALSFVVQKHAASHLHYDFRLELDGVLLSWAVPKGPSLDPQDKRMAVHVEDHPLAYAGFEGTIPPGQYGAGTVIVWDRGEWAPEGDARAGLKAGKLKFELRGEKLQGRWTLVRMRGKDSEKKAPWLLIKERDAHARPAAEFDIVEALPDSVLKQQKKKPARKTAAAAAATATGKAKSKSKPAATTALPLTLAPQLATLVDAAPADEENWRWEMKFDGYRLLARIDADGTAHLFTRNGHDWTSKLKAVARAVAALPLRSAWLDGEIIVPGTGGAPDFQALQNAFDANRTEAILYYVFDLPFAAGEDLREQALTDRRERLRAVLDDAPGAATARLRFSEDFSVDPKHLLHTACQLRMEGLIGKRADAPYRSRRSSDWIKLKCTQRQEFVVVGWTDPAGSRKGLGALLLGVHDAAGKLRYAGKVGSGFGETALLRLAEKLDTLKAAKPAVEGMPAGAHAVKPKLVAEVSFAEWTQEGRVRHAVFHGLRGDKPASAITREAPAAASAPPATATLKLPRLTHPERVVDALSGVTKRELAEYYALVAPLMLPHLRTRPVSLVRGPEGVDGTLFFQKHAGESLGRIPGLRRLDARLDPGHPPLLSIGSKQALLGAVQMNVIEFHTWNAIARQIEQPDRMVFDLDPGEGVAWPRVQEAAQLLRAFLQELELEPLLKTSGGKGLHLVVPLRRGPGWATVKGLAQAIVQHLAATVPQRFVAKSGPKNRVGKIFVDYLRNGRGATTASAWSARARPGLGISVPVAWDELDGLTGGAHWTVRTAAERIATTPDPWPALKGVSLARAMRALDYTSSSEDE